MKPEVGSLWTEPASRPRKWRVTSVTENNVSYICTFMFDKNTEMAGSVSMEQWVTTFKEGKLIVDKENIVQKDLEELLK